VEITGDLHVSVEEKTLIDMHSVLNVLNVIIFELLNLSPRLGNPRTLTELHRSVISIADCLKDPDQAHRQVANVNDFIATFQDTVTHAVFEAGKSGDAEVVESLGNIHTIFDILEVRAREIVARHDNPDAWIRHSIRRLKNSFLSVLKAIEANSKGRYRIVFNPAEQNETDYLFQFEISGIDGKTVWMPAIFQDVVRDLLANARKYTDPGGCVQAGLYDSGSMLRFVVTDTGTGIPSDEIQEIVTFGKRGSNVQNRPTRGGGFGLTKAYYVTRKFNGRFWIDSPVTDGHGTCVEIQLPAPPRDAEG
jgi:signal transduction histidine kinase